MPTPSSSRGLVQRSVSPLRGKAYDILVSFDDASAVIVGLGHEPEQKNAARSRLEQISVVFKSVRWEMFPVFQNVGTQPYVEYFLFGRGPDFPRMSQNLAWIGPASGAVERAARITTCQKDASKILEEATDTQQVILCPVCQGIRDRFLTASPSLAKVKAARAQARVQSDDLMGGPTRDASDDSEHSSMSNGTIGEEDEGDGDGGTPTPKQSAALASSQGPQPVSGDVAKIRPSRQGVAASTWLQVLNAVGPSKVVLAGPIQFQAGLLQAVLQYNDSRFGLSQSSLVAFCAGFPPPPTAVQWTRKQVKAWQEAHLAHHTIERAINAYTVGRYAAMAANQQSIKGGARANASPRVLKKQGTDSSTGKACSADGGGIRVTKFIMLHGNHGKDKELLARPSGGSPEDDSDDPDGDAPSGDVSKAALSKRNARFLAKHDVKVQLSSEASRHGLFAVSDIPAGKEIAVKGPYFASSNKLHAFLEQQPPETAQMLSSRVVRLDMALDTKADAELGAAALASSQGQASMFKVVTNPVGFINHFTGLSNQPNCVMVWKEGMPLGEHCLVVKSTKMIKAGKEWLLNYGPLHQCGARQARKRKQHGRAAKGKPGKKRASVQEGDEEGDEDGNKEGEKEGDQESDPAEGDE